MKSEHRSAMSPALARVMLALLLLVCLAECTAEQRINSRASKSTNIIQKINGWRSQREGSCLSYGHSCWGAHGKRSQGPIAPPSWNFPKYAPRRPGLTVVKPVHEPVDDLRAMFSGDSLDNTNDRTLYVDSPFESKLLRRMFAAKPMLDDDMIEKIKLIMRQTSDNDE